MKKNQKEKQKNSNNPKYTFTAKYLFLEEITAILNPFK